VNLATDPRNSDKIQRMGERVRWAHPLMEAEGIDQARLVLAGSPTTPEAFSFLVIGDSGTGRYRTDSPQRRVALRLLEHRSRAAFLVHTGDVVYLVGSREQYRENFIEPYREWLVGGETPRAIAYDRMVFNQPFLPVPGNHDYYDLSPWLGALSGLTTPLRPLLRRVIDLDVGWHGSFQGDAYARAFLDYLKAVPESSLSSHLERHYGARFGQSRCLSYQPGSFTRLPNRYYAYRYAGVDFFALDSNTFNQPRPDADGSWGGRSVKQLKEELRGLERQRDQWIGQLLGADPTQTDGRSAEDAWEALDSEAMESDELMEKIEQIEEQILDLRKQTQAGCGGDGLGGDEGDREGDPEQLVWLRDQLIRSWRDPEARGRILILHHPPYVTEATKWSQAQTFAVRRRLREVLDAVAAEIDSTTGGVPLVNLVLSGHAHCFEIIETLNTGHADSFIPWIICGGSGYSLRRQRREGEALSERLDGQGGVIARSTLFVGRQGHGQQLRRPYSALRIDLSEGSPLALKGTLLIAEKGRGRWCEQTMDFSLPQRRYSGKAQPS
jgi:hypothetical protein